MKKSKNGVTYGQSEDELIWKRFRQNKGAMMGLVVLCVIIIVALSAPLFYDYDIDIIDMHVSERFTAPCREHPFGTDNYGRDIFKRVVWGSRYSLSVGIVATLIGLAIGVTLGSVAGYYGGIIENVIMRVTDIFSAVPNILLGILITGTMGANTLNLMLAVGIASVPQFTRITRAAIMRVRDSDYVEACRSVGVKESRIILLHILPNCLSPILVQASLRVGSAVIATSSLSFLGLGVQQPAPEWGAILSAGRDYIQQAPYLTLYPGLCIMILVLSLNMIGDGLRDAFDPKLRR